MIDQLIFDPTNSDTIADSHKVFVSLLGSDGATQLTNTTVGPDTGLDVNLINASIAVSATDLDIRDLSASQDNVAISDGTDTLAINADGSINATVTATDLDIRDLTAASDSVASHLFDGAGTALTSTLVGADQSLDVNITQSVALAVSATDLDIRDLSHTQDSIRLGNGTVLNTITTLGSKEAIDVNIAGADVSSDTANTALANTATTVGATATDLVGTDLANRKFVWVYNNSNRRMFIGNGSVTAANGFPLGVKSYLPMEAGASIDLHAIHASVTGLSGDARILELS